MKKIIIAFIILLSTQIVSAAYRIQITQGVESAIPITIIPFSWQGTGAVAPVAVDEVIKDDLARSGEIDPINVKDFSQLPRKLEQVDFNYWRKQEVDALVMGQIKQLAPQRYLISFTLIDPLQNPTSSSAILLQKEIEVNESQLRKAAHYISDLVYEKLTGYRGAFSTRIAYVNVVWEDPNQPPARYILEVADFDGHNPRPLLTSPEPIMSPSWSPDGRKLAYVSFEKKRAHIFISDVATGHREQVSALPGINGAPSWSPDGKKLALVLSKQKVPKIYILDLATRKLEQITNGYSIDTEPQWTPDGRSLIFTSDRGGKPQVYQVELANKKIKRITFKGIYNARGTLSADGRELVMIHRTNSGYHIAVQDLITGDVRLLTQTGLDESPSLAPNGRMILYGTTEGNQRMLGAVSIDGRVKLLLPATNGEVQEPAWSPFLS